MLDLGTLKIGVEVDDAKAKGQLNNLGAEAGKTGGKFDKFKSGLLKAGVGLAAVSTAAVLVMKKIKSLADSVAKYGDAVDKNSQKMGISAEAYQKWDYVLQRNGSSISALKTGMKTFTTQIESGGKAFDTLGVKTKNADGSFRDTTEILNESMTALAGVKDATERTALANELFGKRTAQELLPTLNSGADGIEELQSRAEELGFVMSDETVKACAEYEDAMLDVQMASTGLKNNLMAGMLPALTTIASGLSNVIGNVSSTIHKEIEENGSSGIFTAIGKIALSAITAISQLPAKLLPRIISLINSLASTVDKNGGSKFAKTFLKIAGNVLKALMKNAPALVVALVRLLVSLVRANMQAMYTAVVAIFKHIKTTVTNIWNSIKKKVSEKLKATINDTAIGRFVDKVKNAIEWWKSLKEKLSKKITAVVEQKKTGDGTPHHRLGLREVPFDGYIAELHKGETVLTAGETNQYRRWLNQQAQMGTSEQPQAIVQPPIDYDKLAKTMINALSGMNINTEVNVSGRTIAQATAPFMKTEINSLERRANRALGVV